jgi:hypothetical protein
MATQINDQPTIEVIERPTTQPVEQSVIKSLLVDLRHRITVSEYHSITDAAPFRPEPRVELLEGIVVNRMVKHPPHNLACDLIQHLMSRLLPPGFFASMSTPLTIQDRDGEPEPDVMILRGALRDYKGRARTPGDVSFLIEVSESSYDLDRYVKWTIYAAAQISIYWILDLNNNRLEVHTQPTGQGDAASYVHSVVYDQPDQEIPLTIDGREVARFPLSELLP